MSGVTYSQTIHGVDTVVNSNLTLCECSGEDDGFNGGGNEAILLPVMFRWEPPQGNLIAYCLICCVGCER